MRILGIDPGSHATGYGLIECDAGRVHHVEHGTLRLARGAPLAERLGRLQAALGELVGRAAPDAVAVEEVFVSASPRSALVLGQARGIALAAAGSAGLSVHEYTAQTIKLAVTGTGAAGKAEVQRMVQALLALERRPPQDAADALAVALCHGRARRLPAGAGRGRGRGRRGGSRAGRFVVRVSR
jgi:crossover junction endodeoxyribonuclease RuvC